jgi:hypothetical protein
MAGMETLSTSPHQCFALKAHIWEARNSLWVYSPVLWDVQRECLLFAFRDQYWSVDADHWLSDTKVRLSLRKYPGNHRPESIKVEIDCLSLQATILPATSTTLTELEAVLERMLSSV